MFNIQYEDLVMLRFSNTKSSMLYNLLSVGEAQMCVFRKKTQFKLTVPTNMAVQIYTGIIKILFLHRTRVIIGDKTQHLLHPFSGNISVIWDRLSHDITGFIMIRL